MDDNLADLDLLVDLLDKDDDEINTETPLKKCTMKEGNSPKPLYNNEKSVSSPNYTDPVKAVTDCIDPIIASTGDIDPMEVELLEMEKKMKMLKEKLKVKKESFEYSLASSDLNIHKNKEHSAKSSLSEPFSNSQAKPSDIQAKPSSSFKDAFANTITNKSSVISRSEIHTGDTDSDDDEDNRNPLEPYFSSYGKDVKKRLAAEEAQENRYSMESKLRQSRSKFENRDKAKLQDNFVKDPFSGINIVNPLVTADAMKELMQNRNMIHMSAINLHTRGGEISGDWVTVGVIVSKTETKTSQKGSQYCIWQMSDLKDCSKVVSVFLFSGAYKGLWKTSVGSVVGILNPQIMKDRKENQTNILTLSINIQQKALLIGHSKDFGYCKGRTKQGSNCYQFVNKSVCEFCMYHIQKEYKKSCAKRSEIQSSFSRVDPRKAFQSKVLGKTQIFYGGQLYTAGAPSKSSPKMIKEKKTLSNASSIQMKLKSNQLKESDKKNSFELKHLSDESISTIQEVSQESETFGNMLLAPTVGARNFLKHKVSNPHEDTVKPECRYESVSARDFIKMSQQEISNVSMKKRIDHQKKKATNIVPQLGRGLSANSNIEFDISIPFRKNDINKARAAAVIRAKGPIEPMKHNMPRSKDKVSSEKFQNAVKKRLSSAIEDSESKVAKIQKMDENHEETVRSKSLLKTIDLKSEKYEETRRSKSLLGTIDLNSEKMKKILEAKSKHSNLIQDVEDEEMDKYFNCQEKREMLENKMISIMEVHISAVSCLKCKYTSVTASEICKAESHPLKKVKAIKRFFECKNCKRRTVSLQKLPSRPCENCNENMWTRVGMMKAKSGPKLESEILSLRGDEIGHYSGTSNKVYLHV